jgi:uncharacterized protein
MEREKLYYVLFEQQKQIFKEKNLVQREKTKEILSFLNLKLPIIITGVRRCGKSTLLWIIKEKLKLNKKDALYINFNDERLINFSTQDFQKILDFLEEQEFKENCYLFLDEIQETKNWEKWVDRIKEQHPIFITGSNSRLLSKEISTVLTGRSLNIGLYPFSFGEFLSAREISLKDWKLDVKKQAELRKIFLEYLSFGGIPKVIIDNDKRLLAENYENILYRDIVKRFNKNLEKNIKEISVFLLSNVSKEVSLRSLSKTVQIKNISTLKSILDSFEKAFLFFFVNKFDYSVKKQIQNPRKVYCVDTGFVNEVGFRFSENKGRILKNIVLIELKRSSKEVFYYSDKNECDFVIREKTKIKQAIQVCYDFDENNKKREINGLIEAMEKFKLKKGLILTFDQEDEFKINNKKISIKPVWKWLLKQ